MTRTLLVANVLVAGLGCLFAAGIIRDVVTRRGLPPAPVPRVSQSPAEATSLAEPTLPITTYQVIATKSMFNPGRSELVEVTAAASTTGAVKPILHGVLIDGPRSRAYLEEPGARQVFGYAVGDKVGGGVLDSIGPDRVVIIRADGPLAVLLQDPGKPRPGSPAALAGPPGQRPPAPSGSGRVTAPTPPQPQQ